MTYPIPPLVSGEDLPGAVCRLQALLADRDQQLATQQDLIREYEKRVALLEEWIRLHRNGQYGRRSEKLSGCGDQPLLPFFDELPGAGEEPEGEDATSEPTGEAVDVAGHRRRKSGRKPLPPELPRVDVLYDLPEEEKVCGCGLRRPEIGREISEKLDLIPAKVQVIRSIRCRYGLAAGCRCEGTAAAPAVVTAPVPPQLIPKGLATEGLLAHIMTAKYVDAQPFYRQESQFRRMGVDLNRSTMCSWSREIGTQCAVLVDLLIEEIRTGPVIQLDETPVQVLGESGRTNQQKSYMWVMIGGPPGKRGVVFRYHPSRAGEVAKELVGDYKGYVQTDGYKAYDALNRLDGVILVGCLAHVRRKFVDVVKAAGQKPGAGGRGLAQKVLKGIADLYAIEQAARVQEMTPEGVSRLRQERARPVFEKLERDLREMMPRTPPQGLLGKAIHYALGQWKRIAPYLESGDVMPDNNVAENAIRPFVIGRKNWLFHGHPEGAAASAAIYSLIETAKANGLEPYAYLRFLFTQLPIVRSKAAIRALLPTHLDTSFQPR